MRRNFSGSPFPFANARPKKTPFKGLLICSS
ncbi:hypothetical protein VPHD480_0175 [Vibrio phage D480]